MKTIRQSVLGLLVAGILLLALAMPAYAIDPPNNISILSAKVVQNAGMIGDMSIVFHYNLTYTGEYPPVPASESIMFRLYSPDGSTLLASSVPYVFFRNGYGQGVSCFYFEEAIEWEETYKINVAGSPAHFDPLPDPYFYVLSTSDYSSTEKQVENQEILKSYIISVCRKMEQAYPTYILHGNTDVGTVLTALGEAYFRGAVPGIAAMAPSLFFTQFYVPKEIELEYTTAQADIYKETLEGSDVMLGLDKIGEKAGISGGTVAAFLVFIAAIALIIVLAAKGWGVEPGIIGAGLILTFGALLLGDVVFIMRIFMGFVGGMLIFYQLFLKKA